MGPLPNLPEKYVLAIENPKRHSRNFTIKKYRYQKSEIKERPDKKKLKYEKDTKAMLLQKSKEIIIPKN